MKFDPFVRIKSLAQAMRRYFIRSVFRCGETFIVSPKNSLIVIPHPDDEVFGCAQLIAMKRKLGARVTLLMLTDGEAAHRGCCSTSTVIIGSVRRKLAEQSAILLGLKKDDLIWMAMPDGDIPAIGSNEFVKAVASITDIILELQPGEIYAPVPFDSWPDHKKAFDLVDPILNNVQQRTIAVYYYAVWMWWNLRIRDFALARTWKRYRLDADSVKKNKEQAIDIYMSANNPECGKPYCGDLPKSFVKQFKMNSEVYFVPPHNIEPIL